MPKSLSGTSKSRNSSRNMIFERFEDFENFEIFRFSDFLVEHLYLMKIRENEEVYRKKVVFENFQIEISRKLVIGFAPIFFSFWQKHRFIG